MIMCRLKVAIKQHPGLHEFFKRLYPPRRFFKRLVRPALFWPILSAISPISKKYGLDRGRAIDRYFIEKFLQENITYIKGVCLEIKDNNYTKRYGGNTVNHSDVLDINENNTNANIHDDLRSLKTVYDNTYDCIILTQVLQFIDDYEAAIRECYRILKPNGVLLATMPSISRIDLGGGISGDFWRFTTASARYIFEKFFHKNNLEIKSWGNVLIGVGFWVGLSFEDMPRRKFDFHDPNFPVVVSVVVKK